MKKLGLLLLLGLGLLMTSCNESTEAAAVVEGTEEVVEEMKCEAGKCADDMKTACEPGCVKVCCTADSTKTCTAEEAKACSMKKGQTCGDTTCYGSCDTCIANCKTACISKGDSKSKSSCEKDCEKACCSKDATGEKGKCADMKCEEGKCGK